jgi:hypothetical protein
VSSFAVWIRLEKGLFLRTKNKQDKGVGTNACTTRLTTPGRAVWLMHLWKKREVVKMGIKIGLSEKLRYKQASKPVSNASAWV